MVKKITDTDGRPSVPPEPMAEVAENIPTSSSDSPPTPIAVLTTATHASVAVQSSSVLSFGFDDPMQLEPAVVAPVFAADSLEQQLRRDSETTMVSESSYAFSTDDAFEDLINVS
jgi:hypothetical protein